MMRRHSISVMVGGILIVLLAAGEAPWTPGC